MKTKMILIGVLIIGLTGTVFATEQQKVQTQPVSAATAETFTDGQPILVQGVMEKTEAGLFLLDGAGIFLVQGGNALDKLAGQPVELQGVYKRGEKNAIIIVNQAKVIQ